jgi:1-acyl-sn-glycerol-3-phosphate acyltransferase
VIEPIFDDRLSGVRRVKHAMFVPARWVVLPLLRLGLRMRVFGLKNVPKRGGALVICNHLDWWDPILLMAAMPRPILWMAKSEFMKWPVINRIALFAGAFPVERGKPDRSALRHAQGLLDDGLLVGMFPEGTRSQTGGLKEPFSGVSLVAARSGAPILPCALIGTDMLPMSGTPKDQRPRGYPKVTAIVGEPFRLDTVRPDGGKYGVDALTDAMMIEIARLLPPEYRGLYADRADTSHPAVQRDTIRFTGPADT